MNREENTIHSEKKNQLKLNGSDIDVRISRKGHYCSYNCIIWKKKKKRPKLNF